MNIFDKSDIKQQEIDTLKTESSFILHKARDFAIKHGGAEFNNVGIRDKMGIPLKEGDWAIYESHMHYATLVRIISFENKTQFSTEDGRWYANVVMMESSFDFIEDVFKREVVTVDVPLRNILKYDVKELLHHIDKESNQTHIENEHLR